MTTRPIIFSAPMVRALLEGRKTQTRRVWKSQPPEDWRPFGYGEVHGMDRDGEFDPDRVIGWGPHDDDGSAYRTPYVPGDLLYVREAHYVWSAGNADGTGRRIDYRATTPDAPCTWSPSIHMPRWASRLTLAVTDVRVQRLNDISEDDAWAEGIYAMPNGSLTHDSVIGLDSAVEAFARLWRSINGPDAWKQNPWVVAVTFTVHKVNVDHFSQLGKISEAAQ
jgi:hypothetical protein